MSMLKTAGDKITCGLSRTKQKVGVEHDINKIVAKFKRTWQLPVLTDHTGQFVDTISVGDYQSCLERIRIAEETFAAYPSEFRRRFNNDPQQFLEYCDSLKSNPALADEAEKLGIITLRKPDKPDTTVNKNDSEAKNENKTNA